MAIILVTGGAGYIGSHTCKALSRAGHLPVTYDNLSQGTPQAVRWGPLEIGDVRDEQRLDAIFRQYRPQAVMHFSASTDAGASMKEPATFYSNNVVATVVVLDTMRKHGISSGILSSSCAVYGNAASLPVEETTAPAPLNCYGTTKLMAEQAFQDFGQAYGLHWVALRYFNAAGADKDGELGERHDNATQAVPRAIRAALGLGPPFCIFGTDYMTRDGSAIRDYVHVEDIADAHVRTIDYLLAGGASTVINLGSGKGISVLELIASVEESTGRKVPTHNGPRRAGDPEALYASTERAHRLLGWQPRHTNIDDITASTTRWILRGS